MINRKGSDSWVLKSIVDYTGRYHDVFRNHARVIASQRDGISERLGPGVYSTNASSPRGRYRLSLLAVSFRPCHGPPRNMVFVSCHMSQAPKRSPGHITVLTNFIVSLKWELGCHSS